MLRKQSVATAALSESELRLRQIAEIYVSRRMLTCHDRHALCEPAYGAFGRSLESLYNSRRHSMSDSLEDRQQAIIRLKTGNSVDIEYRIVRPTDLCDDPSSWIPVKDKSEKYTVSRSFRGHY